MHTCCSCPFPNPKMRSSLGQKAQLLSSDSSSSRNGFRRFARSPVPSAGVASCHHRRCRHDGPRDDRPAAGSLALGGRGSQSTRCRAAVGPRNSSRPIANGSYRCRPVRSFLLLVVRPGALVASFQKIPKTRFHPIWSLEIKVLCVGHVLNVPSRRDFQASGRHFNVEHAARLPRTLSPQHSDVPILLDPSLGPSNKDATRWRPSLGGWRPLS